MSSTTVNTPRARCLAALSQRDITPPTGIYHRMWGAATHDRASGVHRPLEAQLVWLQPIGGEASAARLIYSLDHCILDSDEFENLRQAVSQAVGLESQQVLITLTHTHGAGWMSRQRSDLPGGQLIGPYLDGLAIDLAEMARQAQDNLQSATICYAHGRCNLAAHRDYYDDQARHFVCGLNPGGLADDTLLVARLTDDSDQPLAILINYACHPTTLAWDNTLLSPDWVGAMREVVLQTTGTPCLFLQGASGDLGPRHGFVGDPEIADRNGRQVGYAALAVIESLPPADQQLTYLGPVVSGTQIGTWGHRPLSEAQWLSAELWQWRLVTVHLPYRPDLPTVQAGLRTRSLAVGRAQGTSGGQDHGRSRLPSRRWSNADDSWLGWKPYLLATAIRCR